MTTDFGQTEALPNRADLVGILRVHFNGLQFDDLVGVIAKYAEADVYPIGLARHFHRAIREKVPKMHRIDAVTKAEAAIPEIVSCPVFAQETVKHLKELPIQK